MSARFCCRCRKELTDAASLEAGIGPICRKMDNAVLAATIPADLDQAKRAYAAVREADLPAEVRSVFSQVGVDLTKTKAATSKDWRTTVKRMEWILSWPMATDLFESVVAVVEALGYVGVVGLIRGDAKTGKALVWIAEGRTWRFKDRAPQSESGTFLFIAGPRNAAANDTLRAITGRRFHDKDVLGKERAAWSVPAVKFAEFKALVLRCYPVHEIEDGSDWALLEKRAAAAPVAPTPVAAPPDVRIEETPDWLLVFTPYSANFVSAVKGIAYKQRQWNGRLKCWMVHPTQRKFVVEAIRRCFPTATLKDAAA